MKELVVLVVADHAQVIALSCGYCGTMPSMRPG